jgi:hypothetical protein
VYAVVHSPDGLAVNGAHAERGHANLASLAAFADSIAAPGGAFAPHEEG